MGAGQGGAGRGGAEALPACHPVLSEIEMSLNGSATDGAEGPADAASNVHTHSCMYV